MGARVASLEDCRSRLGMYIEFYDPDGDHFGMPTYPFRMAPKGLLTVRQLRSKGLRPGGQPIAAQILWQHKNERRVAYLYEEAHAKPKRIATAAQWIAIGRALIARRTCRTCGRLKDYYIPRRYGECLDCAGVN